MIQKIRYAFLLAVILAALAVYALGMTYTRSVIAQSNGQTHQTLACIGCSGNGGGPG